MGYVPERITDYPQDIDDCPLHIDAEKLREAVEKYYEDPIGVKVASAIASFADSKGLAFPSVSRLSDMTGYTWQEVSKAVGRLQALGVLTVTRRRFKNSQHCHNEYRFVKKFVRKVADIRSSHFLGNVLKWKAKAEDVATAVVDHAVKTVGGKVKQVASAMSASAPVAEPVSVEPVQEKPVQPVPAPAEPATVEDWGSTSSFPEADDSVEWDYVSEQDMDKMFRVFDAHPELVDDPVKAAEMAGVVFPEMKTVSTPESATALNAPVEETTTPIQKPTATPEIMKRETNLETLPANTQPVQTDMTNAPKFINGEVDARWGSQQLLHQLNPTQYPAY